MSDERETIRAAYDQWAATYDTNENATRDLDAIALRAQGFDLAGLDVIEFGCGTGKNTATLLEGAPRSILALDLSEGMLSAARARLPDPRVRFVQHDITAPWPVAAACADLIVGDLVLEHVESLSVVFAQAGRALRSGGQLFVCEFHPYRQLRGAQARFESAGEEVKVPAFVHDFSDYVNAGIGQGLSVVRVQEWRDEGALGPRLLSMVFAQP